MFQITINRGRTEDYDDGLYDTDGVTPTVLVANDELRFKVGRPGSTPILDLSGVATANGSAITVTNLNPATYSMRITQADTALIAAGTYSAELAIVDATETNPANAIKYIEAGIVHVIETLGGAVGL